MGKNETLFNVLKFATMLKNNPNMAGASVLKEMVSFSNFLGGTIFIGVEDNASITGCDPSFNYDGKK